MYYLILANRSYMLKKGVKTMENRDELINDIIDIEWFMLENVNASNPNSCQERPKAFRLMRWVSFSVLPEDFLASYLEDLQQAINDGRNFMIEKYARMENKILPLKNNPLIKEIVNIENKWMDTLTQKYPSLFNKETNSFQNYFACELETYSDRTIELFYNTVRKAQTENRNLAEERYTNLFKRLGYNSIEERVKKAE